MATITHGSSSTTPDLVLGWNSARFNRDVLHRILNRADPDLTTRPTAGRSGTLRLFYATFTDAIAAEVMHALPGTFQLTPAAGEPIPVMTYARAGDVALTSNDDGSEWTVSVPFEEVA